MMLHCNWVHCLYTQRSLDSPPMFDSGGSHVLPCTGAHEWDRRRPHLFPVCFHSQKFNKNKVDLEYTLVRQDGEYLTERWEELYFLNPEKTEGYKRTELTSVYQQREAMDDKVSKGWAWQGSWKDCDSGQNQGKEYPLVLCSTKTQLKCKEEDQPDLAKPVPGRSPVLLWWLTHSIRKSILSLSLHSSAVWYWSAASLWS